MVAPLPAKYPIKITIKYQEKTRVPGPGRNPLKASSALMRHSIECPRSTMSSFRWQSHKKCLSPCYRKEKMVEIQANHNFQGLATLYPEIVGGIVVLNFTDCSPHSPKCLQFARTTKPGVC